MPLTVSLSSKPCQTPTNWLKITNNKNTGLQYKYEFTACLGALFKRYNDAPQLVETLEVDKLLGVDFTVLYNYSISPDISHYIRSFFKDHMLDIHSWYHPMLQDAYYQGQRILLNDCLYRYMYRSKYIIFKDLDEFLVPLGNVTNLGELVNSLNMSSTTAEYNIAQVMLPITWPDDDTYRLDENVRKYNMRTLLKTTRSANIHKHELRSKYIINPRLVTEVTVHYSESYVPGCTRYDVTPDIARVYHYRNLPKPDVNITYSVIDRTMHRFSRSIIHNINRRHIYVERENNNSISIT